MAYLKYSFDIEDAFSNSKSIKQYEVHTLFLTLNNMKVVTIYLPNGILGEIFATSTLQESHSYQDHLFSLDSV